MTLKRLQWITPPIEKAVPREIPIYDSFWALTVLLKIHPCKILNSLSTDGIKLYNPLFFFNKLCAALKEMEKDVICSKTGTR